MTDLCVPEKIAARRETEALMRPFARFLATPCTPLVGRSAVIQSSILLYFMSIA